MKKVNKKTWKKVCKRTDAEKPNKDNTATIILSDNPSREILRWLRKAEKL